MPSPKDYYQQELADNLMMPDPAQADVVEQLQALFEALEALEPASEADLESPREGGWFSRLRRRKSGAEQGPVPQGLYIWGGVGRGKTHLCDMFYKAVTTDRKVRMHYHRFMLQVHKELRDLGEVADPVDKVAERWSKQVRLLVLDEMHINDITDAMLMRHLLHGLFSRSVVLVTTSNRPPDDLYEDGLQREQFLPAIALMKAHTRVLNLNSQQDYRLRALEHAETYLSPIDASVRDKLEASFTEISGHDAAQVKTEDMMINDRPIPIIKRAAAVVWLTFDSICNSPRSNRDYIEITNYFHTVIISDVPQMDRSLEDAARRFVNMIDEFYDHGTKLIISAEVGVTELYCGQKLAFEFDRAVSRLREMRSHEYLARERTFEPPH
jgi:cell division protein ZapE